MGVKSWCLGIKSLIPTGCTVLGRALISDDLNPSSPGTQDDLNSFQIFNNATNEPLKSNTASAKSLYSQPAPPIPSGLAFTNTILRSDTPPSLVYPIVSPTQILRRPFRSHALQCARLQLVGPTRTLTPPP